MTGLWKLPDRLAALVCLARAGRQAAPLSLADAKGKEAVILDYPLELFLPGLAHGRGETGGSHVAGAELLSPRVGNTVTREWPVAASKGLKADKPRRPLAPLARWPRWPVCCASRHQAAVQSCRDGKRRPGSTWHAGSNWSIRSGWRTCRQASRSSPPQGEWKVFEVDWDPQGLSAEPTFREPATSTPTGWKEPLWNKVSDEALKGAAAGERHPS